jgi:hypothetical protein
VTNMSDFTQVLKINGLGYLLLITGNLMKYFYVIPTD